jgi:glycosyltransferase involved in cell wall biosynthesis
MLKNHRFFWKCIGALPKVHTKGVMIGNSYFKWPKKWLKECYLECNLYALQKNVLLLENADRRTIAEALTDADIFIFGSKVECSPLVMFEAFASKTLFVTTDCGNVRDYEDIVLIVENVEQAVNIIRSYQENPKIYLPRIEKAYTLAQKRLNWNNLANEYEELYLSLHR